MRLSEIVYECSSLGNKSTSIELDWVNFINRAQRRICQRFNWSFCHDVRQTTVPMGQLNAPLDINFKELSAEKSPISYNAPSQTFQQPIPCIVISRAMGDRMGYLPFYNPMPTLLNAFPLRYVYIERDGPGGQWNLRIPQQYMVNPTATFNISAYYYPDPLKGGDDNNGLTNHPDLADALINLTKAMAYFAEDETSKRGQASMALYEIAYRAASYTDLNQRLSGRQLSM